ncbi:hypothetical protein BJV78DRAFT_416831 [Lactifluus subvellereus]|nr:hypothetical protein BJV78DRAFT_416831 [Lactifluus subvellereus]
MRHFEDRVGRDIGEMLDFWYRPSAATNVSQQRIGSSEPRDSDDDRQIIQTSDCGLACSGPRMIRDKKSWPESPSDSDWIAPFSRGVFRRSGENMYQLIYLPFSVRQDAENGQRHIHLIDSTRDESDPQSSLSSGTQKPARESPQQTQRVTTPGQSRTCYADQNSFSPSDPEEFFNQQGRDIISFQCVTIETPSDDVLLHIFGFYRLVEHPCQWWLS